MEPKLNPKQKAFAEHYAVNHNGKAAAVAAGYSEKTARQQAYDLLQLAEVKSYIAFLEKEACTELNITRQRVLAELEKIAFSNIGNVLSFGADGVTLKESEDLTEDVLATISEVTEKRGKETSLGVKMHSKLDALKTLAAMEGFNAPVKTEGKLELEADALTKTVYSNKLRVADPE